jgi:DNA-binding NarL/FixJ family response regulator
MAATVERARVAFARQAWREAFTAFRATAESASLDVADHERLAVCAYLVGEDDACAEAWEGAHRAALDADDAAGSARCAFWLALCLMLRGQMAQAAGWLTRAEHLIEHGNLDCAASGYLLVPKLLGALDAGDPATARELAVRATELGRRFDDADLHAFGTLGHGQALIAMGDSAGGTARLDDVMVSVTAGEVGPVTSGIVYCAVILECMQVFDVQRASEWTDALSAWCDAQPDLVSFRGQCLVHRSQLQQAAGAWPDAITTVEAACRRLADPPHPALGLAYYQKAELHRLAGAFDEAANDYRQAGRHGHDPMPGLALLELARGHAGDAATTIRRALHEIATPQRPALLSAAVEIFRANGDLPGARSAADELAAIAAASSSVVLRALAAQATGTVLTAEGDSVAALSELRVAATAWRSLRMPYDAARTAVLLGLACSMLGDRTSAALEFDNARETFSELGAAPDLAHLATLTSGLVEGATQPTPTDGTAALTARERQVLAHVASGKTNKQIAAELVISEHTVGRHLDNVFTKMRVTSRAAATAYAYEHDLL